MDKILIKGRGIPVFLILWVFCTATMFWIEADSYTHDIFVRGDTGWFMAAGRFMMEGQVPYVDFADSKGLLLWLIYGLGYLMCNHNYIGVFWIETIISAITFLYSYKTAKLLLHDKRLALFATILMAFPYYTSLLHGRHMEFRCEDFCLMPIAWGIYYLEAAIRNKEVMMRWIPGIMLGFGFVYCIMIKWTIGVMYMGLLGAWIFWAFRSKQFKSILSLVAGIVLFVLPFVGLFLYYGNFDAFIYEYFVNTGKTINQSLGEMLLTYFTNDWPHLFKRQGVISFLWIVFAMLYCYITRLKNILPILSGIFILSVAVKHDLGYYTIVVAPFAIYACVMFVRWVVVKFEMTPRRWVVFIMVWYIMNTVPNFIMNEGMWYNSDRELFYKIEYILAQVKKPSVILSGNNGVTTRSLAGTKYWLSQLGETKEMALSRREDVKMNKADFVFGDFEDIIDKSHYEKYNLTDKRGTSVSFWGPKGLKYPTDNFCVSDLDILFKKRVINAK